MTEERTSLWLEALRLGGYRLTAARRAVVQVLSESVHTMTPGEVFEEARQIYPHLGLVSVYRTLEKLESLNLIQRIHNEDGCHAYFPAANGHQHILLCRQCGRAVFFDGDDLQPLIDRLSAETGYRIESHWLQLFGLCAECLTEEVENA